MALRGQFCDGPMSKFVPHRLDYLCVKFGASIKNPQYVSLIAPQLLEHSLEIVQYKEASGFLASGP